MTKNPRPYIALGSRLTGISEVLTLGVRPNFDDYSHKEKKLISASRIILYPTLNYAQLFTTMGKKIYPNVEWYLYADEKIKQTTLFYMLGIPHPRTRIYYRRQQSEIPADFPLPFIAKIPRGSAQGKGVFLITTTDELENYLKLTNIAYIQEYIPHTRNLRIVLINYQVVVSYFLESQADNFRTNLFQGGVVDFEGIPEEVIQKAEEYSRKCRFNEVGLDFIQNNGIWYLIEANMLFGRNGLKMKGLDLKKIVREKLLKGELG
ncbi:MAG: ATP-grasp domain-containing protein [Desulfobulbaceae bacterium]|nr:ATP-grasp domain-containing protein [Desulfobulbaceae bacterium]MCK5323252.1 ATP-grasp domain-containing protein [Desulfobulbaceae bacterium]MCK5436515.1 ATP-grasp domain-containing protein [Desulfobulbaceae bacterium]MCK5543726.1 ATP-grasp domain-containing protein [Desulfobulbaceae bacterium]